MQLAYFHQRPVAVPSQLLARMSMTSLLQATGPASPFHLLGHTAVHITHAFQLMKKYYMNPPAHFCWSATR